MKKKKVVKRTAKKRSKRVDTGALQAEIDRLTKVFQEKQELLRASWEELGKLRCGRCELVAIFTEGGRLSSIRRLCSGATFDLAVKAFEDAQGIWNDGE